jgi:hypothetical protein
LPRDTIPSGSNSVFATFSSYPAILCFYLKNGDKKRKNAIAIAS